MRSWRFLFVLATSGFGACSASAQVFVGPNVEWSHWNFAEPNRDFSGNVLGVGGFYLSPGLRVGYLLPGRSLVVSADAGIQSEDLGSLDYTSVIVEPGLAYAFISELATSPYIGVSYGWHHLSLGDVTRAVVGGTVGVRHRVAAGHGFVRGEFRYDHFIETDTKGFILPEDIFGLRVGVDLLISR